LAETGIADTTAEVFSRTVAVNLTGTFLVIQAAAPLIQKAGRGTIVNIASGVGLMPTGPGSVAYVASKGGVVALTKSVAMELAPNIRVNSVCPGAVETAMTAGYIRTPAGDPNPAITARYAMGRHAQPEELAAAILFLTSDESSFMTGIALPVDGGRTFHPNSGSWSRKLALGGYQFDFCVQGQAACRRRGGSSWRPLRYLTRA
jgi:NAD(P)-dependent dehydrogenase (short-subunit alcohol dehydrogenase family)